MKPPPNHPDPAALGSEPLYETYRPTRLTDVLGQTKAVRQLERIAARGPAGRAYWISGASGTGKTTLARILARLIADPLYITEYDAADDFTAAELARMRDAMQLMASGPGGRVWIINEAHGLRRQTVRQLLGVLERLPRHCMVIFTTTRDGQGELFEDQIDAGPLLSRCLPVALTTQGLAKVFAERAREIALAEDLDGKPPAAYLRLIQECKNNMRAALERIEFGEMLAPPAAESAA